jgi:hypothetical protein
MLLGPHDFVYKPCVADADCPRDDSCSAARVCGIANAATARRAWTGKALCASGNAKPAENR